MDGELRARLGEATRDRANQVRGVGSDKCVAMRARRHQRQAVDGDLRVGGLDVDVERADAGVEAEPREIDAPLARRSGGDLERRGAVAVELKLPKGSENRNGNGGRPKGLR